MFGGSRGCFTPTINICIFFFYPACTYSVGRALSHHSIRAQGDPKMSRDVPKTGEQGDAQYGHCVDGGVPKLTQGDEDRSPELGPGVWGIS